MGWLFHLEKQSPESLLSPYQYFFIFVFIKDVIEVTGTFKYRKVQLVEQGFNPAVVKDVLYFLDDKEKMYVLMTPAIYDSIQNHSIRLWASKMSLL